MSLRVVVVSCVVLLSGVRASVSEPHACHGMQMFDTKGLPPEPLRDGVGTSDFPISTQVPKAREMMRQGIALLHDFWHFEAYRSFLEVVRLDPKSPMGYFGLYLVYSEFGKTYQPQAKTRLDEALQRIDRATDHERYYLLAAKARSAKDDATYHIEMGTLIDRFPSDIDAKLLLAAHLQAGYDDEGRPKENQTYGQAILEAVLAQHPDHVGANHYFVHAFETSPHPQTALEQAEKLPRLAPHAAHLVHMPGHIYYRLGDYEKARAAFEASMHVDEAYLSAEHVHAADDWNYSHNLAYLIAVCAEDGRYAEGQVLARKLESIENEPVAAAGPSAMPYVRAEAGDFALARLQVRNRDWSSAKSNQLRFPIDESQVHPQALAYRDGLRSYIEGMSALTDHRLDSAARAADEIDATLWRLQRVAEEDWSATPRVVLTLESDVLRAQLDAARGHLAAAEKRLIAARKVEAQLPYSEPPQMWTPVDESLGQLYLDAHDWTKARQAFMSALTVRPRNGHSQLGIAEAEVGAGHIDEARSAYTALLDVWSHADQDLPGVREAKAWLVSHPKR